MSRTCAVAELPGWYSVFGSTQTKRYRAAHEPSYGSSQMRNGSTMRRFDCRGPGFPPIPRPEPQPKPDTEPQPGSDPDVIPPVGPEPEPGVPQPTPEPEPMPM